MIDYILRRMHWAAVNKGGLERVEAARWFLKKMCGSNDPEIVGKYWGTGSDLIYYHSGNVKDRESKVQLNEIEKLMIQKCRSVGIYPGHGIEPAFKVDDNNE